MKNKAKEELWEDYLALAEKYSDILPAHELGFGLIQLSVKMLMDIAPRHEVALETIKIATEEGIKWHVEERAKQGEKK